MAAFEYVALDGQGRERRGVLEADSVRQLRQLLRDRGLAPLKVESTRQDDSGAGFAGLFSRLRGMGALERALMTRQLATLIGAAIPIEESLGAVAQQSESRRVRSTLMTVRARVLEGHSLAGALAEHGASFPAMYRAAIAAGEHSGHLDKVLDGLADYTERQQQSQQNIQMAMLYPIILTVLSMVIGIALMTYVVPQMAEVFEDSDRVLPLVTRVVMGISAFLSAWWPLLLLLVAAGTAGAASLLRQPDVQRRWHRTLLRLPFIGRVSRGRGSAQVSSTLAMMTSSGVPLVEAMRIGAEVIGNRYLRERVVEAAQRVSEGTSLHSALLEVGHFPPLMLHMIASGEASGELDNMLARIAQQQEMEIERLVTTAVRLFEPLMLVLMGVVVLTIVMSILMPIMEMNNMVGQ